MVQVDLFLFVLLEDLKTKNGFEINKPLILPDNSNQVYQNNLLVELRILMTSFCGLSKHAKGKSWVKVPPLLKTNVQKSEPLNKHYKLKKNPLENIQKKRSKLIQDTILSVFHSILRIRDFIIHFRDLLTFSIKYPDIFPFQLNHIFRCNFDDSAIWASKILLTNQMHGMPTACSFGNGFAVMPN